MSARQMMEGEIEDVDNLFWMSLGLTVGVVSDPADTVISFFEYLDTGDPTVLLFAAIPLIPGAAARAMRVARSLPSVADTWGLRRHIFDQHPIKIRPLREGEGKKQLPYRRGVGLWKRKKWW
jgi:hypothetical protein